MMSRKNRKREVKKMEEEIVCKLKVRLMMRFPREVWRLIEKTHASSPSTSGKTHEKPSVIQTRR